MKPLRTTPRPVRQTVDKFEKNRASKSQPRGNRAPVTKGVPFIELFQREDCPYSHAVRTKLTDLGLDFVAHNVSAENPFKHEQLVQAGGKDQIPFLVDHKSGVKLYESSAILAYLENEYGEVPENPILRIANRINTLVRGTLDRTIWRVRRPIDRARDLRSEVQGGLETAAGSVRVIRDVVKEASTGISERLRKVSEQTKKSA